MGEWAKQGEGDTGLDLPDAAFTQQVGEVADTIDSQNDEDLITSIDLNPLARTNWLHRLALDPVRLRLMFSTGQKQYIDAAIYTTTHKRDPGIRMTNVQS